MLTLSSSTDSDGDNGPKAEGQPQGTANDSDDIQTISSGSEEEEGDEKKNPSGSGGRGEAKGCPGAAPRHSAAAVAHRDGGVGGGLAGAHLGWCGAELRLGGVSAPGWKQTVPAMWALLQGP